MVARVGASHEAAIDADILHFSRLGLDAVRLSFWGDWEASDAKGNLIDNDHLRLLDYLVWQAGRAGIYMLLSPIVTYDASWPDAMERPRSGFSSVFKKEQLGLDPEAIAAQANYLGQILDHRNRYSGTAYKDDPAILAIEPVNEPFHHPEQFAKSVAYINTLVSAIRKTGCTKPVFYNVSEKMAIADAVGASRADGATFGWYPTGLMAGHTLTGNFLPLVDDYSAMRDARLQKKAKLVYEFDAPDLLYSYMYPAMARTFRRGGIQFATMFTYDSLPLAAGNLEFQTHYLNLVCTPHKAISLMIAAEVFRRIPRGSDFGAYPDNMHFGPFHIDDAADLSEMVSDDALLYSNDTRSRPRDPSHLRRIAGCGSSPLVEYEGNGCYFLDRVDAGAWRLEVYPDAVYVDDPFAEPKVGRDATRLLWRKRKMAVQLQDIGSDFYVNDLLSAGSTSRARQGVADVRPGVYLLAKRNGPMVAGIADKYIAMPEKPQEIALRHEPPPAVTAGEPWKITAAIAATDPVSVTLRLQPQGIPSANIAMSERHADTYEVEVDPSLMRRGLLEYAITVRAVGNVVNFPASAVNWHTQVLAQDDPLLLFDPARDREKLMFAGDSWGHISRIDSAEGKPALRINPAGSEEDVCCQWSVMEFQDLLQRGQRHEVRLHAIARAKRGECTVVMIERDSSAWGATLSVPTEWSELRVSLKDFSRVRAAQLPRGYPRDCIPYWRTQPNQSGEARGLQLSQTQHIQFVVAGMGARIEIRSLQIL